MKVLHVQKIKGIGGSERYFAELIPRLETKNVKCALLIFYLNDDKHKLLDYFGKLEKKNIKFYSFEINSDFAFFKILKSIKHVTKDFKPDIVNSHLIHADFWMALYKIRYSLKAKLVSTKHGYDEEYIDKNGFDVKQLPRNKYFRIAKFAEKKMDAGFCVSKGLSVLYNELTITHSTYPVIHHAFESEYKSTTKKIDCDIIILGRYTGFKNHRLLIQAISVFEKKYDILLTVKIAGLFESDAKDELLSLIKANSIKSNIIFTGHVENVLPLVNNSRMLVCPSTAEGFGLVVLEAIALKTKVIINNVPALNEIINKDCGWICEKNNPESLADQIKDALETSDNNKEINAFKKLQNYFNYERMINEVVDFYSDVL